MLCDIWRSDRVFAAGASPHALDFVRRTARAAKRSTQNGSTGPRSSRRAALAPGKEGLISRSDLAQLSDMLAAVQVCESECVRASSVMCETDAAQDKPEQPERRSPERQRQRVASSPSHYTFAMQFPSLTCKDRAGRV